MIVQNVDIKNFRGIEYASIEFKPGFNLIKGRMEKVKLLY